MLVADVGLELTARDRESRALLTELAGRPCPLRILMSGAFWSVVVAGSCFPALSAARN